MRTRRFAAQSVFFVLAVTTIATAEPPPIEREFRAAWVATVANIDWPSKAGLPVAQQKAEIVELLDVAQSLHLNAIILQVRPAADAMYPSKLEPWSEYLTGKMGSAPDPAYDPLAFAVEEAHRRCIELHAWFNPYRARHKSAKSEISSEHISVLQPELVREYDGYLWLDPGEPGGVEHSLSVILDVVRRYDIDGVHLDDYFYPYPIDDADGKKVPFPDEPSWQRRGVKQQSLSREDWRRANVDHLIEQIYTQVKQTKRWVQVGISPFGIWRPGHPASIKGFDAYAELYADAKKWQQEGWVDYLTPQLYWKIDSEGQSYPKLLQWWHEQNVKGRHLWPGNYASRLGFDKDRRWDKQELLEQIRLTREHQGATGNVHFSMKTFLLDYGDVNGSLVDVYAQPALPPASPWLGNAQPAKPTIARVEATGEALSRRGEKPSFRVSPADELPHHWVVQSSREASDAVHLGGDVENGWTTKIIPADRTGASVTITPESLPAYVTAVSRTGICSQPVKISAN